MKRLPFLLLLGGMAAGCKNENDIRPDPPDPPPPPIALPLAIVGPGGEIKRMEEIGLDGSRSYDVDFPDATLIYRWELAGGPSDATVTIGDPAAAQTTFTADKLGTYLLQLTVTDEDGLVSDPPASVAVTVVPWENLEVSLAWDKDVDLDLHVLAPGGIYTKQGDCHFGNPAPDWGSPDDLSDDPELSWDDDLNGGPEEVALAQPEEGEYTILVTMYNPRQELDLLTTAHLILSAEGEIVAEIDGVVDEKGEVWVAGTLDWETLAFSEDGTHTTHSALGGEEYNH